jgi:hypothetical protein
MQFSAKVFQKNAAMSQSGTVTRLAVMLQVACMEVIIQSKANDRKCVKKFKKILYKPDKKGQDVTRC